MRGLASDRLSALVLLGLCSALLACCWLLLSGCNKRPDNTNDLASLYAGKATKFTISDPVHTGEPPVELEGKQAAAFNELATEILEIPSESGSSAETVLNTPLVSISRTDSEGESVSFTIGARGAIYLPSTDRWYYPTRRGLLFVVQLLFLRENAANGRPRDGYINMMSAHVQDLREHATEELHLENYSQSLKDLIVECIETYNREYAEPGKKIRLEGNRIR